MAAAPVHYIRTIHTSFTAAHPHSSSAWAASHASASSMSRVHTHSNILQNMSLNYTAPVVSKYPPGLGAPPPMGRKRSASIRVAPPAYAAQRIQRVKFDPFAEDSESTTIASNHNTLVSSSVLYNSAYQQHHHAAPASTTRPASSMPYTIQIPPAAPADIQRHHQQQLQYRQQRQQATPPQTQTQPVQQRVVVPTPTPPRPSQTQTRTATTATVATANREREARSKIVAGILLNRVHAVGKPMRRRVTEQHQPRPYVPSGLSSCISIEA